MRQNARASSRAAKVPGNTGQYLRVLNARFGVGVVVRYVRPGMAAGDLQVRQQVADGPGGHGGHGGAVIGVDVTGPGAVVGDDGVLHERFRQVAVLAWVYFPVNDLAGEDVEHHVQVEIQAAPGSFKLGDVPGPYLVRAVGDQLGPDPGRVGGLGAGGAGAGARGPPPGQGWGGWRGRGARGPGPRAPAPGTWCGWRPGRCPRPARQAQT